MFPLDFGCTQYYHQYKKAIEERGIDMLTDQENKGNHLKFTRLFIIFWFEKPQRSQSTQRKSAPLCALCVLCGWKTMQQFLIPGKIKKSQIHWILWIIWMICWIRIINGIFMKQWQSQLIWMMVELVFS